MAAGIRIDTQFSDNGSFKECSVNGVKFALFDREIASERDLNISLNDHYVIILAPLSAENNITIVAHSILSLCTTIAQRGETKYHALHGTISILGAKITSMKDNKIVSKGDQNFIEIFEERKQMILGIFRDGINRRHGPTIVDGLQQTYDAIIDPKGEDEEGIDVASSLQFFGIPSARR